MKLKGISDKGFRRIASSQKKARLEMKVGLYDHLGRDLISEMREISSMEEAKDIILNAEDLAYEAGTDYFVPSRDWGMDMGNVYEDGELIGRASPNGKFRPEKGV